MEPHHHFKTIYTPSTIQPDDAAANGAALGAAREDHKHAIVADVAGAEAFGDTATEGVATSFARSDHRHSMPANPVAYAAPGLTLSTSNTAGAASTLIRSDATIAAFDITAPSTQALGDAAAVGSAAVAARRDHKHALTALTLSNLPTVPTCRATRAGASTQSITNATNTAINCTTEDFDTDTMHDNTTNNTRVTATTAGKYVLTAAVEFTSNATGTRGLHLRLNGTTFIALNTANAVNGVETYLTTTTEYSLSATDYVEAVVYQSSGGALTICPAQPASLCAVRVAA